MNTTLTERYIAATVKTLPPTAQDDVRAEPEASIADAVEARVEQGEEREKAERVVLVELGDPAVLAAGYADRPLHPIGPRYYLTWWRLLKLLLIIVPACVVGAVALGQALAILWDQFRGFARPDGDALPFLNPGLWPWAIAGLLALIGLEVVFAIVLYLG